MKQIHKIVITAFAKPEEDTEAVKEGLKKLTAINLENEKVELKEQTATGFEERKIKIFKTTLSRQQHIKEFIRQLKEKLGKQCETLIEQKQSRLDQESLDFYIRIGKDKWMEDKEMKLTDSGYCYHIKITLAAYPAKREKGLEIIEKILTDWA